MLFKYKNCEHCGYRYDQVLENCPHCKNKNEDFESLGLPKSIFWLPLPLQITFFLLGFSYGGMFLIEFITAAFINNVYFGVDPRFILNCTGYIIMFTVMASVLAMHHKTFRRFFMNWKSYGYGLAFAAALVGGGMLINLIMSPFNPDTSNNQSLVEEFLKNYPVMSVVVMGFLGPVVEECTYRIGLYTLLRRLNKYAAFIITSLVFALIHLSFDPSTIVNELLNLPSYLLAGVAFSLAYELFGPVCSMFAHITYNCFSLFLILAVH